MGHCASSECAPSCHSFVSTACASPMHANACCFGQVLKGKQRWVDLVDSDDEEEGMCTSLRAMNVVSRQWADIVDTDADDCTWVEHLPEFQSVATYFDR